MNVPTYEEVEKILYGQDDDSNDDEEKPAKPAKKDSDEDEDEDESSTKKSSKKDSDSGKCPFGHKFGVDSDEFDDCEDCDIWDRCACGGKK